MQYDKKYDAKAYMPIGDLSGKKINTHLGAMLAAQELNIPCVNAYSGSVPNEYIDFFNCADDEDLDKWCKFNNTDKNLIQKIYFGKCLK